MCTGAPAVNRRRYVLPRWSVVGRRPCRHCRRLHGRRRSAACRAGSSPIIHVADHPRRSSCWPTSGDVPPDTRGHASVDVGGGGVAVSRRPSRHPRSRRPPSRKTAPRSYVSSPTTFCPSQSSPSKSSAACRRRQSSTNSERLHRWWSEHHSLNASSSTLAAYDTKYRGGHWFVQGTVEDTGASAAHSSRPTSRLS